MNLELMRKKEKHKISKEINKMYRRTKYFGIVIALICLGRSSLPAAKPAPMVRLRW